ITSNKNFLRTAIKEAEQIFPAQSKLNKGEEQLSRIYLLKYDSVDDPLELSKKISKQSGIEWAEPKYIHRVTYSPNDSIYVLKQQKNLRRIYADSAWTITKGDTSVLIAIVDTGVDWTHPDLAANILKDNSGGVIGYDFGGLDGTPDNDPREDPAPAGKNAYHGTHVAGIAGAVTDNKIGIASIGFNCTLLPVKASRSDRRDANGYPFIYYGFEGIKYAADKGAKIINCSWGGYSYSLYEQEIIDYATSKGTLVVAAAGNEGILSNFYPAGYKGVLSVGWLETESDLISTKANYGRTVDVFAPGSTIISTWQKNLGSDQLYNFSGGSSMASPLTAGLAGLVASKFPTYTPLQIAEQIRMTADNIDAANADSLKLFLGRGRINAFRAVSETNTKSVRAVDINFIDEGNKNGRLESGETVSIEISFINFLNPVTNVSVKLESSDNAVVITNSSFDTGALSSLASTNNQSNKFQFKILTNAPFNYDLYLLLKFSGDGYSDFQWISTRINPSYDTHNNGKITMSVTSKGTLAFNDFPTNLEGDGFKFNNGDNLMFEGALMYGTGPDKLIDAARSTQKQSTDFVTVLPVKVKNVGNTQEGYTVFSDAGAGTNALGIETRLSTYSYAQEPNDKFVILNSSFYNTTAQDINGLYAGYYVDWDLPQDDPTQDSTYFDQTENFAVVLDKTERTNAFVGAALISSDKFGYYPIDNNATSGEVNMVDSDGFSDAEKWLTISGGIKKKTFGLTDVSYVVSGGPFNLPAKQSTSIAFAIAAGSTIDELKNAIRQSRIKYSDIRTSIEDERIKLPSDFILYQNYPNPFNPSTVISYQLSAFSYVTLKVYDVLGREVATLVNEEKQPGTYEVKFSVETLHAASLPSGVYFYRLSVESSSGRSGSFSQTKKLLLLK
ncbi:MAG: S8 family serine peptidase, partial [Bacteroidota bacterium]